MPAPAKPARKYAASRSYKPAAKKAAAKPYAKRLVSAKAPAKISKDFALKYLSPWYSPKAPADSDSFGNFTTLNAVSRNTLVTSTTQDTIVVYSPSNQGLYNFMVWTADGLVAGDLNNTPNRQFFNSPPDTSRTLRGGLRLRNLTTAQNVGGIVHVVSTSSALDTPTHWANGGLGPSVSEPFAQSIANGAKNHPKGKSYTAGDLVHGINEVVSVIASNSDYHQYKPWNNASLANSIVELFDAQNTHMSMNNIIMVFPATDVVNTYELSLAIQIAGRYPMDSVLGGFSMPAPAASNKNLMKDVAEAAGQGTVEVVKDPLIAMLGGEKKKR